jgi:hypothetical protein
VLAATEAMEGIAFAAICIVAFFARRVRFLTMPHISLMELRCFLKGSGFGGAKSCEWLLFTISSGRHLGGAVSRPLRPTLRCLADAVEEGRQRASGEFWKERAQAVVAVNEELELFGVVGVGPSSIGKEPVAGSSEDSIGVKE